MKHMIAAYVTVCSLVMLLFSTLLVSCSTSTGYHKTVLAGLNRVAILPMDRASTKPAGERPTCNISGAGMSGVYTIPVEASERATMMLFANFAVLPGFFEVSEEKCLGFLSAALASDINRSQLKIIQMYGRELGADAVLYGKIHRYRDRVGSDYSVDTPASVSFTLVLVHVADGATLWRYSFDQTQQALTDNLLNFKLYRSEGMKWLTADEFMDYGIRQAAADLAARFDSRHGE